jgi:hypothetical protein
MSVSHGTGSCTIEWTVKTGPAYIQIETCVQKSAKRPKCYLQGATGADHASIIMGGEYVRGIRAQKNNSKDWCGRMTHEFQIHREISCERLA